MGMLVKQCLRCGAGLPEQSLQCEYCETTHLVTQQGIGIGCPRCGVGNLPTAPSCVSCRHDLLFPCPECRARNPVGCRFCAECQIEFQRYRHAVIKQARNQVSYEAIETLVRDWLGSGWFRARDLDHNLIIMDRSLTWIPTWVFRTRALGRVQGQKSQTHYRTKRRRDYDHERGEWTDVVDSVPYTVWNEVSKDFDKDFDFWECAAADEHLARLISKPSKGLQTKVLERPPQSAEPWESVADCEDGDDQRVFLAFRKSVEKQLHKTLLDRVEMIEIRHQKPSLALIYLPVWSVIYRYKRKRKKLTIDGATRHISGQSVSILSQWFG